MIFFQKILHGFANLRLAVKFSIIMVAIILVMAILSVSIIETKLTKALFEAHSARGVSIARGIAANALEPSLTNNLVSMQLLLKNTQKSEDELIYAYIVDDQNNVLAHTFEGGFPTDLLQISNPSTEETGNHHVISTESGILHDLSAPILDGEIGYVHVGLSQQNVMTRINSAEQALFVISFIITILTIAFSFLVVGFITRPLGALATAAEKLSGGNLNYRVESTGKDEIGTVATVFNAMAETIQNDIEKQFQLSASLRKSESLYRSLVENIELGVTLIDNDHNIIMANSAQGKMFNKPAQEFTGKKCFREFEKRSEVCSHCPGIDAIKYGRPSEIITEGIRDDNSRLIVKIRAFPIISKEGEIDGFIEVVEDITDSQRIEEELHRAKKIESIGVLAGGIAHDFNNLLLGIIGNISLAQLDVDKDSKQYARLKATEKAALRARDLTQQLLTFSKGGAPILNPTDIKDLVKDSVDFALSGSPIGCNYDFAEGLMPVNVDGAQISQVIQNIVTNAEQAMTEGGTLEVRLANIVVKQNDFSQLTGGHYIKMTIRDQGLGIPQKNLDKIFDPYFSTKESGSGLGLTICYSIIKKHGGLITVDSIPGTGTTFDIYLQTTKQDSARTDQNQQTVFSGEGRILVMDDQDIVREIATEMLTALGYQTAVARDGDEAIGLYREAKETDKAFDLVIMDLTIPGGMGGKEAVQKLKEYDSDAKVVVSSGYSNEPILSEYRQYGFVGVATKPYKLEKLSQVIQQVLEA
jgi:PAS domain S-box-containing protein